MDSKTIRNKFIKFFVDKGHKEIAPAKLVPENDPSTLFTSSGMQPLVPYLLGQEHPEGKRLVNSQPSFRAEDIDEVGDNRHTTFFEMLGNWSLGDYFKEDQLKWCWEFLTKEIGLDKEKLYITVFDGDEKFKIYIKEKMNLMTPDVQAIDIWTKILGTGENEEGVKGFNPKIKIYRYGAKKNWWSRSGTPEQMPVGEIGGPDSEVFYDFGKELKLHENSPYRKEICHLNCNCGRFMEICNSVFIQYKKIDDRTFEELPNKNVDFGGGLERIAAASNNDLDVFKIDLNEEIIAEIEANCDKKYSSTENQSPMRVIADHMKAATFLIVEGIRPSNKLQGYILRRLLRRSAVKMHELKGGLTPMPAFRGIGDAILQIYDGNFGIDRHSQKDTVGDVIDEEMTRFAKTLDHGLKEIEKIKKIDGKIAFDLYQTFGFPYEVTEELFRQKGQEIDREQYRAEFEKHRELSRTASAGMFKGGLADHSEIVTKYHTATHLLHQALRDVLGPEVFQKGSNITSERLRFDFSYDKKMTDEEIKKVEEIINKIIAQDLKVDHMIVDLKKAKSMNAIGLFNEKYADKVSIYGVGPRFSLDPSAKDQRDRGGCYSLEFCGGPHVEHTAVIGKIKITKEEAISSGMRRIRAQLA